mmetsp:Transcript_19421/g.60646  ORF Transcript_19421/g.60646 Transcript_19421/m.60646 type:complete len:484 (-) Transcript_19421:266-1717(-)
MKTRVSQKETRMLTMWYVQNVDAAITTRKCDSFKTVELWPTSQRARDSPAQMTRISAFIASSAMDMTHASKMRSTCACAIAYPKTSGSRGEEVLGSLKPPQPLARGGVALPDLHAQPARRRRGKDLEEGGHRLPHAARPLNLDASHLERESGEAHRHPVVVVRRHCRVAEGGGGGRGDGESVRRNLLLDARLALAQLVPQCRHALALLLAQHAERSEGVRLRGERRDGDRRHHRVAQIRRRVPRNDTRRQLRSLGRIGSRAAVAVAATVVAFGRRRRRQTWELCVDLPAGSSLPLWGLAGEHAHRQVVWEERVCSVKVAGAGRVRLDLEIAAAVRERLHQPARHLDVRELVRVGPLRSRDDPPAARAREQQGGRKLRRVGHAHQHRTRPRPSAVHERRQPLVGRVDAVPERSQRSDELRLRPLVHARDAGEAVHAAPQAHHRRQEAGRSAGVRHKELGRRLLGAARRHRAAAAVDSDPPVGRI